MKTIRRYVAVQIFWSTALVFAALLLLFAFFDFIQELGDIGRGSYRLSLAALYVVLSVPGRAYEILPVAALIGTLFALAQMVAHSSSPPFSGGIHDRMQTVKIREPINIKIK